MAEIFVRTFTDDLDGKPIDPGFEHRVTFSYQGANYQIDLRPTNADKLEAAFAPFIQSAQQLGATKKNGATQQPAKKAVVSRSPEQLQAIRDWANNKRVRGVKQRKNQEANHRGVRRQPLEALDYLGVSAQVSTGPNNR